MTYKQSRYAAAATGLALVASMGCMVRKVQPQDPRVAAMGHELRKDMRSMYVRNHELDAGNVCLGEDGFNCKKLTFVSDRNGNGMVRLKMSQETGATLEIVRFALRPYNMQVNDMQEFMRRNGTTVTDIGKGTTVSISFRTNNQNSFRDRPFELYDGVRYSIAGEVMAEVTPLHGKSRLAAVCTIFANSKKGK